MKGLIVDDSTPDKPRLTLAHIPKPKISESELLIRVRVSGLNRADLGLTPDHYAPNTVVGTELAGEVVEVGASCSGFSEGDRVMALSSGSHAEFAKVDHRIAVKLPDDIDWQTAASLPAWFMTAYDALITQGKLRAGETVLIQGITSGVGQAAAQLAKLNGAKTVIGVARSQDKLDQLTSEEVDQTFAMKDGWAEAVREATGGQGVDLIIDMVGGGALNGNLQALAICGRMVAVGRLGGASDTLDIGMLAFKRAQITGVTFRSRNIEEKAAIARAFASHIIPLVVAGKLKPRIDRIAQLAEAGAAQELMRDNKHFGKILLAIV